MGRPSKDSREFLELVHFTGTRKKRTKRIELGHDAAKRKYVHRIVVTAGSKDVFGRSVPARTHVLSKGCGVPNLFDQAKVSQLDCGLVLHQNVLWFNVAMKKSMLVDVVQAQRNLSNDVSYFFMREGVVVEFSHLHHAVKIHVEQLEHH